MENNKKPIWNPMASSDGKNNIPGCQTETKKKIENLRKNYYDSQAGTSSLTNRTSIPENQNQRRHSFELKSTYNGTINKNICSKEINHNQTTFQNSMLPQASKTSSGINNFPRNSSQYKSLTSYQIDAKKKIENSRNPLQPSTSLQYKPYNSQLPNNLTNKPELQKVGGGATSKVPMNKSQAGTSSLTNRTSIPENQNQSSKIYNFPRNSSQYKSLTTYQIDAKKKIENSRNPLQPSTSLQYKPYNSQLPNNLTNKPELQKVGGGATSKVPSLSVPSTGSVKFNTFASTPELIEHEHIEPKRSSTAIKKFGPPKYYIINFKNFNQIGNKIPSQRRGSVADVKALQKMFQKLKMVGQTFEDMTLIELKIKMVEISMENFSENSAIVIVIMSHGDTGNKIYAKDDIFDLHTDIIDPLSTNKHLSDKPKIFFIEACKGTRDLRDRSMMSLDTNSAGSNTFVFEATFENFVSYTERVNGSFFTQSVCQKFEEMGETKEIHKICIAVMKDVQYKSKKKQCPTITKDNLTTDFCFGNYY